MGQRANYILIEESKHTIYYNHQRANCITSDLYLGQKTFLAFVKDCELTEMLMNLVWIEGCVIVDLDKKHLFFWGNEIEVTSVFGLYLKELRSKWEGWSIEILYNRMYDVEKILNIDYISKQNLPQLPVITAREIIADEIDQWINTIVIIKSKTQVHVTAFGNIPVKGILNFGHAVINLLLDQPKYELQKEGDSYDCIIIDTVSKNIIINRSKYGLWEQTYFKWFGYSFKMGDFGYIGILQLANIDVEKLIMSAEKSEDELAELIKVS